MYPGCQSGSCGMGPALRTWVCGSRPWPSPARRRWCAAGTPPWPRSPAGRRPPDAPGLQERRQETLQRLQVFIVIILWFSIIIYCLIFIPRTEKILKYLLILVFRGNRAGGETRWQVPLMMSRQADFQEYIKLFTGTTSLKSYHIQLKIHPYTHLQ